MDGKISLQTQLEYLQNFLGELNVTKSTLEEKKHLVETQDNSIVSELQSIDTAVATKQEQFNALGNQVSTGVYTQEQVQAQLNALQNDINTLIYRKSQLVQQHPTIQTNLISVTEQLNVINGQIAEIEPNIGYISRAIESGLIEVIEDDLTILPHADEILTIEDSKAILSDESQEETVIVQTADTLTELTRVDIYKDADARLSLNEVKQKIALKQAELEGLTIIDDKYSKAIAEMRKKYQFLINKFESEAIQEEELDGVEEILSMFPSFMGRGETLKALLEVYVEEFDELEIFLKQLEKLEVIDEWSGKTLDMIGDDIGEMRGSKSDQLYKSYLKIRELTNKTSLTVSILRQVIKQICGVSGDKFKIIEPKDENVVIQFQSDSMGVPTQELRTILPTIKGAGILYGIQLKRDIVAKRRFGAILYKSTRKIIKV